MNKGPVAESCSYYLYYYSPIGLVTFLTGGAASFFSRCVSVVGQSSPQHVACGVFVSVGAVTAPLAGEHRLGDAVLSRSRPERAVSAGHAEHAVERPRLQEVEVDARHHFAGAPGPGRCRSTRSTVSRRRSRGRRAPAGR